MKTITYIFLFLSTNIFCQNLIGTNWIKVNEIRKDGSIIHDRKNTKNSDLEYHFKSLNKLTLNSSNRNINYNIKNSELTIGTQKYTIEKLNTTELIISEQDELNILDDKKNRLYFIEEKNIINYLISKNLLSFVNDSTVMAKQHLHPKLKNNRNLDHVISKSFKKKKLVNSKEKIVRGGFLLGTFRINTLGQVDNIEIKQNSKIYQKIEEKLIKTLKKIEFIPIEIQEKINQIVNFKTVFIELDHFQGIQTYTNQETFLYTPELTIEEKTKTQQLFNNGISEFDKKNYLQALKKFDKVIEIDSLFFDAYYNRAYANLIIKNKNKSCKDWKFLKKMGQKRATNLYNQKCTKN